MVLLSITSFLLSKERNPQGLQLLTQVEGHRVHGPWRLGHLGMLLLRCSLRAIILNANVLRQAWNAFCLWGWQMRHGMNLKFELTPLEVKKVKRRSEREWFLLWVTGATFLAIKHKEPELVIYEYIFDLSAAETQKFRVTRLHKVVLMTWGAPTGQKQKSSTQLSQGCTAQMWVSQRWGTQLMGLRSKKKSGITWCLLRTGKSHKNLRTQLLPHLYHGALRQVAKLGRTHTLYLNVRRVWNYKWHFVTLKVLLPVFWEYNTGS